MVWDYCEVNPFSELTGSWGSHLQQVLRVIERVLGHLPTTRQVSVYRTSALTIPFRGEPDFTPPLLIHRTMTRCHTPTCPTFFTCGSNERLCEHSFRHCAYTAHTQKSGSRTTRRSKRTVQTRRQQIGSRIQMEECLLFVAKSAWLMHAVICVMYAHKSTSAWESLVSGLTLGGFSVSASWPFHTEMTE